MLTLPCFLHKCQNVLCSIKSVLNIINFPSQPKQKKCSELYFKMSHIVFTFCKLFLCPCLCKTVFLFLFVIMENFLSLEGNCLFVYLLVMFLQEEKKCKDSKQTMMKMLHKSVRKISKKKLFLTFFVEESSLPFGPFNVDKLVKYSFHNIIISDY